MFSLFSVQSVKGKFSLVAIESGNITLREFKQEDARAVHEYAGDPIATELLEWGPNSFPESRDFVFDSLDCARAKPRTTFDLAIVENSSGKVVGGCGLILTETVRRDAFVGYVVNRLYWGKGYATEATSSIIDFGFRELGLEVIQATCDAENIASQRVLEKSGMHRVNLIREHRTIKGKLRDTMFFQVARSQWEAAQDPSKRLMPE